MNLEGSTSTEPPVPGVTGGSAPPGRAGLLAPLLPHTRELDAIRGVAIALVYVYHADFIVRHGGRYDIDWSGTEISPLISLVRVGSTGVNLFFVLSGFLLGRPFLIEAAGGLRVRRRQYFLRRALRILPMYVLVVVTGAVVCAQRPADLLRALPWLLFLSSFGLAPDFPGISGVWWSLATEVQFYLLLPLLPLALHNRRVPVVFLCYAGVYIAFLLGLLTPWFGIGIALLSRSVLGRSPALLLGIAVAWLHVRFGDTLRASWASAGAWGVMLADALLVTLVVALAYLLRWVAGVGLVLAEFPPYAAWHVPEAGLWGALLSLILLSPSLLGRLLTSSPLVSLGVISYSVFLLHYPVLQFSLGWLARAHPTVFDSRAATATVLVGLTAFCLGLSTLTYLVIERPAMRWRRRVAT
jgi:peptidoglycan/LPS O-acetylase OafA/YrhL